MDQHDQTEQYVDNSFEKPPAPAAGRHIRESEGQRHNTCRQRDQADVKRHGKQSGHRVCQRDEAQHQKQQTAHEQ